MEENHNIPTDRNGTQSDTWDDVSRERSVVSARWASALRRLMEQRRLTQLELSALAGIDKDTVTNIMRGESSSTATLEKLAQALGVDVSELVLTAEQSRVLAESRLPGEDLARRISKELSASLVTASALASVPDRHPSDEASPSAIPSAPAQERRSGRDRRQRTDGRTGAERRITSERSHS
jgi:transcriptional regulator with XRE-family HTH domain